MTDQEILGVAPTASRADVQAAYKRLSATEHPDRHPNDPKAAERFKRIRAAFERLDKELSRIKLGVSLESQIDGSTLSFDWGGQRHHVTIPPKTPLETVLEARREDGAQVEAVIKPIAPTGWYLEPRNPGLLVTERLVTWLAAYRGDAIVVRTPLGLERTVQLVPGTDTGMHVDLPAQGFITSKGRMPARIRWRLVTPTPGSQRLIAALEAPWA